MAHPEDLLVARVEGRSVACGAVKAAAGELGCSVAQLETWGFFRKD